MSPDFENPENGLLFIELDPYAELADEYLGVSGRAVVIDALLANPEAGDMIQGTGGARKLRAALPGKGKSGGARVIYYYRKSRTVVYLLSLYPKNRKSNLSVEDVK